MKNCSLFPKTIRRKIQYCRNRLAKAYAALQYSEERTPEENRQRYKDLIIVLISVP